MSSRFLMMGIAGQRLLLVQEELQRREVEREIRLPPRRFRWTAQRPGIIRRAFVIFPAHAFRVSN